MKHSFIDTNQNTVVEFEIILRKRKTVGISIDVNGIIRVFAPQRMPIDKITELVKSKSKWIQKKSEIFNEINDTQKIFSFESGEELPFCGKLLILQIVVEPTLKQTKIVFDGNRLIVSIKFNSQMVVKSAVETWYKERAKEILKERVEFYQKILKVEYQQIKIKSPHKRWGSCSSQRNLMFNWRIILAPQTVLDYLVVHELGHLVHMNHSKIYWSLIKTVLPNYEIERQWLKKNGYTLYWN